MRYKIFSAIYLITGVLIGLGAFGHGFLGVRPIRAAIDASDLSIYVRQVIWIVWYFVSAAMITFGVLIVGAWFTAWHGVRRALAVPIVIGVVYIVYGIGAYAYQSQPFWLTFVVLGGLLLISTLGLKSSVRR